ncbi:hypothetical protein GCM10007874_40550 [Labrys miyagiensis]|uniref:Uncharacterized protein n=1 Tax=Labrys miyagiensis TaxID=346912 RepID=A0ABQ6CMM8_9HYPH|nr:hypothetical protein GCM10007874_40550 [Labrys miyagiensis]
MQTQLELKPLRAPAPLDLEAATVTVQRQSDPNWKPEPCGLSREELRKIVAEILG